MDKLLKVPILQFKSHRTFSCTAARYSKKNFRKFVLPNRGSEEFRRRQEENPDPDIFPITFGVRKTYIRDKNRKKVEIPELIPEIIVPDLTDFKLKPYVSYRATEVTQSEFTARDLFDFVYRDKIVQDFKSDKLDENGNPKEPSTFEKLKPEQAKKFARMTGSDLFAEGDKRD